MKEVSKGLAEQFSEQAQEAARMKEICKQYTEYRWDQIQNFLQQLAKKGQVSGELGNLLPDEITKLETEGFDVTAELKRNCPTWTITWGTQQKDIATEEAE